MATLACDPLRVLNADECEDAAQSLGDLPSAFSTVSLCVDTALDGREANEATEHAAYDVVVLDIEMPRMDGFTAAVHIREIDGETLLVAVSGDPKMLRRATAAPEFDPAIRKPVDVDGLLKLLLRRRIGGLPTG